MKIFLTGATGFIGSQLRDTLLARGDELVCPARHAGPAHPRCRWIEADLASEKLPFAVWLDGVDAVVNAVGIFRERAGSSFDVLHTRMPVALFQACAAAGVQCVVQLSALGADSRAAEAFLRSKYQADHALLALPLNATVVMPSLVFGTRGTSSRHLLMLASLPLLLLPAGGRQRVQPVHVDDVVAAVCALLDRHGCLYGRVHHERLALVGPQTLSLRAYLQTLRQGLGMPAALGLAVPRSLMQLAAHVGEHLPAALLNRAAWTMLERGSTAHADPISTLLQRPPREPHEFIAPQEAHGLRQSLQLTWLIPVLRASLAAVWILTGVVSMGVFPVADSVALLERAGVSVPMQLPALYGAAALDLALGMATLLPQRRLAWRRWLWALQGSLVLGYTAVISVHLPEFWLHPYGPISKNLPMLAVLLMLWFLDRPERHASPAVHPCFAEERPWNT